MNKEEMIKNLQRDYRRGLQLTPVIEGIEESEADKYYILEGRAVVFGEETTLFTYDGVDYKEIIDRSAFEGADISNVFLKYNHLSGFMGAARTKNGTLNLEVREDGVYITAKLSKKLPQAEQLYRSVEEGIIDKMSFAFSIKEQSFNRETNTWTVRKIDKVFDVAAVDFPAYENTQIYARRLGDVEALQRIEAEAKIAKKRALVTGILNIATKTK